MLQHAIHVHHVLFCSADERAYKSLGYMITNFTHGRILTRNSRPYCIHINSYHIGYISPDDHLISIEFKFSICVCCCFVFGFSLDGEKETAIVTSWNVRNEEHELRVSTVRLDAKFYFHQLLDRLFCCLSSRI